MQSFTQAHAVSHGDLNHEHDGVPCEVISIAAEQVIQPPPAPKNRAANNPNADKNIVADYPTKAP